MFSAVKVIGRGRVGSAVHARLTEQGLAAGGPDADLVLLCVPDSAIAGVAAAIPPGPWIAHVSGATPLTGHERSPSVRLARRGRTAGRRGPSGRTTPPAEAVIAR
jgi:hypothetical protein